jgi:hypothetical protein
MIKEFSKWLELMSLPNCSNEGNAYAFLNKVFSSFGAPTKVFTNQGMKISRDFQELCEKALIDHWITS